MKKTATALALLFSVSSFSAPAHAVDADTIRLGLGLGLAIAKKLSEGHQSKPRVRTRDKSAARTRANSKAVDTAAATPTATAVVLPEIGPVVEWRPDPATVAADQIAAEEAVAPVVVAAQPSVVDPTIGIKTAVIDELGRSWGEVDLATIAKIGKAQEMGMSRMDAIKLMTGRTEPLTMSYSTEPYKAPAKTMTAEKAQPVPAVVVEQKPAAVTETDIAKSESGQVAATVADPKSVSLLPEKEAVIPAEVPAVVAVEKVEPPVVVDHEKAASVTVDQLAVVEKKIEVAPRPIEKPKPKLDIAF